MKLPPPPFAYGGGRNNGKGLKERRKFRKVQIFGQAKGDAGRGGGGGDAAADRYHAMRLADICLFPAEKFS